MNDDYSRIPNWIIEKVKKPCHILAMSVDYPIRINQFPRNALRKKCYPLAQSPDVRKFSKFIKEQSIQILEKKHEQKPLRYFMKKNSRIIKTEVLLNPIKLSKKELFNEKNLENRGCNKYQPRVYTLPPIQNQVSRSVAYNELISSIGIKYHPSDEENTE